MQSKLAKTPFNLKTSTDHTDTLVMMHELKQTQNKKIKPLKLVKKPMHLKNPYPNLQKNKLQSKNSLK